jgi:hypothetical protein
VTNSLSTSPSNMPICAMRMVAARPQSNSSFSVPAIMSVLMPKFFGFNVFGLVLVGLGIGGAQPVAAQDDKVYASVSGMLSTQGAATPYEGSGSARPGVSGTALGVSGEFGGFLTRSLSLAFEASVPTRFESLQGTGIPTARIDNQHRDLLFSGLFHIHVTSTGPIRIALVAGPSVIREDTLQRVAYAPFGSTNFGAYGPETALGRWTVGLTGGADMGVLVSRRVQIVPEIRLHWVERASVGNENASLALGSIVIRPAVGVRVSF